MLWLAVILCLLVSFVFSGFEAGILSVNRVRLRHRVKRRESAALRLAALLEEPERLLLTGVVVTQLMNIFAIVLATGALAEWWGIWGYAVALVVFLPLMLVGLELFPKSLFRRFPYRALAQLSWPLWVAERLFRPLLRWTPGVAKTLLPNGGGDETQRLFQGRDDFKYALLENEQSGAIPPAEREMLQSVVDFHALTARDLMRPLVEFPEVRHGTSVDELLESLARLEGEAERVLVRSEAGEIEGIVNRFDLLVDRGARSRVGSFVRPLATVDAAEKGPRLVRRLRGARTPVALVTEEGRPIGLLFRDTLYRRMIAPPVRS